MEPVDSLELPISTDLVDQGTVGEEVAAKGNEPDLSIGNSHRRY